MSGLTDLLGGGKDLELPKVKAENVKRTAAAVDQTSETARKNRRRGLANASAGRVEPRLANPGLLGVPGVQIAGGS